MQRRTQRLLSPILVFVMLQIAWFGLLGLWIYWFVANYITFTEISERFYPQISFNPQNISALVGGIVLLVGVASGISVLFYRLLRQVKMTRMYDSFIANVTHELKSPLASIQIHLETLRARELEPEQESQFLDLMMRDTNRLEKHITSILQIAGLEERRSVMNLEVQRADELFIPLFERAAEHFGISSDEIEYEVDGSCQIRADVASMEIVIENLVDNAVKYTVGPPEVSMRLSCEARSLIVSITDHGIGIAPRDQKQVFRKFQRLDNPDSPSVKGTGLGLYWVREIVRHHRGKVGVTSEGQGMGSTFFFEIPLLKGSKRKTHELVPSEREGR